MKNSTLPQKKDDKKNLIKDGFFGWENFKWIVREVRNIYSNEKSFFSKKRLESGFAFMVAQWGMIFFLIEKHKDLSMGEFLLWATTEFAVSGYIVSKIQKEKTENISTSESTSESTEG